MVHKIHNMIDDISSRVTNDSNVTLDAGSNPEATTAVKRKYHMISHSLKSHRISENDLFNQDWRSRTWTEIF